MLRNMIVVLVMSTIAHNVRIYVAQYKAYLKRNDKRMIKDWYPVHTEALNVIDRNMGINFFGKSKVPGSCFIRSSDEVKINIQYYNDI